MSERAVWPVVVIGVIAILIVHTGGAFISKGTGLEYDWFLIPTLITYAGTGFAAGWRRSIPAAAVAAIIVGFIDVTLGWWIAWIIGPGREELKDLSDIFSMVMTFRFSVALAAVFGIGGGMLAHRMRRRTSQGT